MGLAGRMLPLLASGTPEEVMANSAHPLAPKRPHYEPRAKRVIMVFLTGGVSHIDSWDPKPETTRRAGEPWKSGKNKIIGSLWKPAARGQSGIETTDLFPHLNKHVDDMCFIRSMHGDFGDHFAATLHMHTGSDGSALPSIGAWASYGLGTDNINLPSSVVFAKHLPYAGAQVWDSNFLPAYHQGVRLTPGDELIPHLKPQPGNTWALQQEELAFLDQTNARHAAARASSKGLKARSLSFKTATSLQRLAPDIFTLKGESDATLDLYGIDRDDQSSFGWQTLMSRRLLENGVRFVELFDTGASGNWDLHSRNERNAGLAKNVDQPIAGLLADLKQRGMLEDTLVIGCSEFGRTPWGDTGRGHNARGFTCWLAGGGARGGHAHGTTDEMGYMAEQDPVHVHDFHATILHLMGLDHEQLTFRQGGRDFRLTGIAGKVVNGVIA
jgi:hypothetical protein